MYDAVLVGSGHNNLVAGVLLARAGWKIAVLEQAEEPGGAVKTAELTLPGFRHDVFSAFHFLILLSPFYREMRHELSKHGLEYLHFAVPTASMFPDGSCLCLHRDLQLTLASLERSSPEDARAWEKLYALYGKVGDNLVHVLSSPTPSLGTMAGVLGARLRLGPRGTMELAHMMTLSARDFAAHYFRTNQARAWFVPWALHLDHSPETAGGGGISWLFLGIAQDPGAGVAIPTGGSGRLVEALVALLRSMGGEIHTGTRVTKILVRAKSARGVQLADGTRILARRAVVACLTPTQLFLDLVGADHLPGEFVGRVGNYRYGLSVLRLELALAKAPAWAAREEVRQAGVVHLAPSVDHMSLAYNQALRGYLPEEPLLVVGHPTSIDSTRAPQGKHILWVMARSVPYRVIGDAAGEIGPGSWDDNWRVMA